jgi:alternative squalene epoxidase
MLINNLPIQVVNKMAVSEVDQAAVFQHKRHEAPPAAAVKKDDDVGKADNDKNICSTPSRSTSVLDHCLALIGALIVWPGMSALPLAMNYTSKFHYTRLFPPEWYAFDGSNPKPLGLTLGIATVAVGQVFVWIFFYLFKFGYLGANNVRAIQKKGAVEYNFWEGLQTHISQPEGFAVLAGYLAVTWMMNWMPVSYYSFEGGIQWKETFLCLMCQDCIQYIMHRVEHDLSATFYQNSHKPHHRFLNPRLFDAFNGSLADTLCMIILPLFVTSKIVRTCNVWTYMVFGSSYSCWLTLIHSEYVFGWDWIFRRIGFGTPADHHVHHKFFKYNYGHLFLWWDQLAGTYKNPNAFGPNAFNNGV